MGVGREDLIEFLPNVEILRKSYRIIPQNIGDTSEMHVNIFDGLYFTETRETRLELSRETKLKLSKCCLSIQIRELVLVQKGKPLVLTLHDRYKSSADP